MKALIGLKELRENVDTYIAEVKKGKSFIIVRRSEPVFKITPPHNSDESWETVIDFTEFYKDGIPARRLLKKLRLLNEKSG